MTALERLRRYLEEEHVSYELREHAEAYTTQEIAALEHVAGRRMAKVVVVLVDEKLVMLVLPASRRVSGDKLVSLFPGRRVRLAHEEEFTPSFPDCAAGAMPPFGNLYGLGVYADLELAKNERIVFQAGTHRHTMEIAYGDFMRLVQPQTAPLTDTPTS